MCGRLGVVKGAYVGMHGVDTTQRAACACAVTLSVVTWCNAGHPPQQSERRYSSKELVLP